MSKNLVKNNSLPPEIFTCVLETIFTKPQKIIGVFTSDVMVEKIDGVFVTTMWQEYLIDTGACNGRQSAKTNSDGQEFIFENRPQSDEEDLMVSSYKSTYEIDKNTNVITITTIVNYEIV